MTTYAEKIEALKTSERILKAVLEFRKDHPLDDWEGDAQEFFESVGEDDVVDFFKKLYMVA